ncbi:FAD/NAD(P)-binding protein [Legionella micdadei]|uniref:Hydrogenase/sulfur reductase gamma subunit n=1 Tax=Legionella micdadei TaxID=451 RepID=A0A098GE49_LEGMI|nr:FAD/NAD(P)-binding protein [Legionella micdadei]ARG97680.1 Ni/Fe hydrogenase subunit gamma [Legionella micdadei]ARH00007.1 Ni/Fe hydrogenase subunit gamma [Legionella micdadei]KTD27770.1 hydrogenase/sulfur reductase subunit gamma [Legionella micdadei]NSL17755.1 FAD/NAD(P)-binding protein [Legionella micdadei]CEG60743.1 Hydrogenase/sulfur reductase gamma subunit [Legionella micdadei]
MTTDAYLPHAAKIKARRQESPTIFTLDLQFVEKPQQHAFSFYPGQFNMLCLYGVGEVAISISSDPEEQSYLSHTIRAVGRVTKAMQQLKKGDYVGIRGPLGKGWPVKEVLGKDIVVVTGGLGCAPTVSVINYILARRQDYGALKIFQGVKHSEDFIFRKQYKQWQTMPDTEIYIAADQAGPKWPWRVGYVTDMIESLKLNASNTVAMMCGPQGMMLAASLALINQGVPEQAIYLSMERNMECGIGHCGHCQYGGLFICKDGPIFAYDRIKGLFTEPGF